MAHYHKSIFSMADFAPTWGTRCEEGGFMLSDALALYNSPDKKSACSLPFWFVLYRLTLIVLIVMWCSLLLLITTRSAILVICHASTLHSWAPRMLERAQKTLFTSLASLPNRFCASQSFWLCATITRMALNLAQRWVGSSKVCLACFHLWSWSVWFLSLDWLFSSLTCQMIRRVVIRISYTFRCTKMHSTSRRWQRLQRVRVFCPFNIAPILTFCGRC